MNAASSIPELPGGLRPLRHKHATPTTIELREPAGHGTQLWTHQRLRR